MNKAIAWFASNHVAANLLMLFLVLGGVMTIFSIKTEVFPETTLDTITVSVVYSGASPAEVEESIIRRIEEKIAGLSGIRRIEAKASEGLGVVTVEALSGWDIQKLLDEVKGEVDRMTTLPEEAEKPTVKESVRKVQVLWLGVYGDAPEATLKALAEDLQDDITNLPNVTQAELLGVRTGEIHIEVSDKNLRRHGLTLGRVADAVRGASLDLPAGSVKTKGGEILLRTKGRRYFAVEYGDIPVITRADGSVLTLDQIANIKDGFEDSDFYGRFNGKPSALIQVFRVADQNALTVAEEVKGLLEKVRPKLPQGIDVGVFGDQSIILKSRMNLLMRNMALGLVLVILVLGFFLEIKLAFWVTLGIPISFLIGLWCLPSLDISINMISLFAFILVLGIVVDDAIVVGENVFKQREQGVAPLKAATKGAQAVASPVIFAVLTTIVAFAPLTMGTGMMGKLVRNIPVVVIVVLLGSLLESLFILPAHLARSKHKIARAGKEARERIGAKLLKAFISGPYKSFLTLCLKWRYAVICLGICTLLLTLGTFTGGILKFTFFPKVEGDTLSARLSMLPGTPIEQTGRVVRQLEQNAERAMNQVENDKENGGKLIEYIVSLVGINTSGHAGFSMGSHVATIFVQLMDGEKRNSSAKDLGAKWRDSTDPIADSETLEFSSDLFSAGNSIEVHLSSPNENDLLSAVEKLKEKLGTIPGVVDVSDSFTLGKDELQITLKPSGRHLGLTLGDISNQVRQAFYGAEALRLQRGKDEVKVKVRYPEAERKSLADVERMRIRTPAGDEVPLMHVADIKIIPSYNTIERTDRRRVIRVIADVNEKEVNAKEVRLLLENEFMPRLVQNHQGLRFDMEGEAREESDSMKDLQEGFILALFGIYILLAVPFKSFSQPFVVMMAIPFGIVGAMWGHLILGYDISVLSLFGLVGLSGVVVNDSLLLIFTANELHQGGVNKFQAVRRAGELRFRPILLTSVTTFAGLAPMMAEQSLQAQFLIPMAVSLAFGVLFATGITLLLIPCGYLIHDDLSRGIRKAGNWLMGRTAES